MPAKPDVDTAFACTAHCLFICMIIVLAAVTAGYFTQHRVQLVLQRECPNLMLRLLPFDQYAALLAKRGDHPLHSRQLL